MFYIDESSGVVYTIELSKQGRSTVGIVITGSRLQFIPCDMLLPESFKLNGFSLGLVILIACSTSRNYNSPLQHNGDLQVELFPLYSQFFC